MTKIQDATVLSEKENIIKTENSEFKRNSLIKVCINILIEIIMFFVLFLVLI